MSLFLITGAPGTGKTSTCNELKTRGYTAYDGDEDFIAQWFNSKSGKAIKPRTEVRTPEFIATHHRSISPDRVIKLQKEARDKPVFLCNNPRNEAEIQGYFAKIIVLELSEDEQQQRLKTRTNNEWGKLDHELKYSLDQRERKRNFDKGTDIIRIDSSKPTPKIVDDIIRFALGKTQNN